jgi:hypothetical protein
VVFIKRSGCRVEGAVDGGVAVVLRRGGEEWTVDWKRAVVRADEEVEDGFIRAPA